MLLIVLSFNNMCVPLWRSLDLRLSRFRLEFNLRPRQIAYIMQGITFISYEMNLHLENK